MGLLQPPVHHLLHHYSSPPSRHQQLIQTLHPTLLHLRKHRIHRLRHRLIQLRQQLAAGLAQRRPYRAPVYRPAQPPHPARFLSSGPGYAVHPAPAPPAAAQSRTGKDHPHPPRVRCAVRLYCVGESPNGRKACSMWWLMAAAVRDRFSHNSSRMPMKGTFCSICTCNVDVMDKL